jgi:hypothetical protein
MRTVRNGTTHRPICAGCASPATHASACGWRAPKLAEELASTIPARELWPNTSRLLLSTSVALTTRRAEPSTRRPRKEGVTSPPGSGSAAVPATVQVGAATAFRFERDFWRLKNGDPPFLASLKRPIRTTAPSFGRRECWSRFALSTRTCHSKRCVSKPSLRRAPRIANGAQRELTPRNEIHDGKCWY